LTTNAGTGAPSTVAAQFRLFVFAREKDRNMSRSKMTGVERAAAEAARLEAVAKEQAEIGKMTIDAIENGADPEIAMKLADAAVRDISIEIPNQEIIPEPEPIQVFPERIKGMMTIRYQGPPILPESPLWLLETSRSGENYNILIHDDKPMEVAADLGNHLIEKYPGSFFLVPESVNLVL